MRRIQIFLALCAVVFALSAAPSASAQDAPKWEVFGGYTYMRTNIVVTGVPFNLNGGSGSVAYNVTNWFGFVGELGVTHQGAVASQPFSLTLTTYRFGPRFSWRTSHHLTPFAQTMIGGGHAGGSLYTSSLGTGLAPIGTNNAFNISGGGGVDWKINSRFGIRLIQAEYLHTQFLNRLGNTQNNFQLSTGVTFSFGKL